jgi:DNA polymerase-3 subunit epsilon
MSDTKQIIKTLLDQKLVTINWQVAAHLIFDLEIRWQDLDPDQRDVELLTLIVERSIQEINPQGTYIERNWVKYDVKSISYYTSKSGNPTWRLNTHDNDIVYIRQSNKNMFIDAGLPIESMKLGDKWTANFTIYCVEDGDFMKPVHLVAGGTISKPEFVAEDDVSRQLRIIKWADKLMKSREFVVLDTETHDKDNPYPIEISVIDPDGNILFNQLVKLPEGKKINPESMAIHGITHEMIEADGLYFDEVWKDLKQVLSEKTVITYNAEFDCDVLFNALPALYHPMPGTWECAMLKYAEFAGDWNDYHGNYRWHSLTKAAQALGVEITNAHRALGDAQTTLAVIKALAAKAKD